MPEVTRLYVHAAWLYFLFGVLSGAVFLANQGLTGLRLPPGLVATHTHALLVGWAAQWVMGIAYWIYPRPPGTRAHPRAARAAFALLNLGLLLRLLAEPLGLVLPNPLLGPGLVASALLQATGALVFVASIWERIAPPRPADCAPGK
ncbi:MAG: hypothetical protein HY690_14345 [Chloroflexi bacterium]|nr:hypothetical protein [Chloroflexota bacterium]